MKMNINEKDAMKPKGLRLRKNNSVQNREEVSIREEEHKHVTKQIVPQTKFCNSLVFHLAYDTLCQQVESLREEMYDNGNESHKEKLLELWRLLRPDDQIFSCYGKHWRLIGFQSDDPSRDFRGMGILSLEQLIYMAKTDTKNMRSILVLSNHPKIGFPLVITAINMTSLCHHLLKEGLLKNHFRNLLKNHLRIEDFHDAYCRIFILFADYWKKTNPPSILNFNIVRMKFESILMPLLKMESSRLTNIKI